MVTKLTLTETRGGTKRWMGVTSLAAVCVLIFSLTACGAGSSTSQDGSGGASESASGQSESGTGSSTAAGTGQGTGTTTAGAGTGSGTGTGTGTGTGSSNGSGTGSGSGTPATGGAVSSESYLITVYYTAVESFHTDAAQNVSGCLIRDCSFGNSLIGTYPASFIKATKTEGTGRITSGTNAGKYLNWSSDVGYWLDTIPSDGYGGTLVPFRTAAADAIALPKGTQFRLVGPLKLEDGSALDVSSANRFLSATWLINDQFTPGLGGALHLDVYVGEEDRVNFTNSAMYTTLANVKITRL